MQSMTNPYIVLMPNEGFITAFHHEAFGRGRQRRRKLIRVVHVPYEPGDSLPDVLRRVATQMETHPHSRWLPPA